MKVFEVAFKFNGGRDYELRTAKNAGTAKRLVQQENPDYNVTGATFVREACKGIDY